MRTSLFFSAFLSSILLISACAPIQPLSRDRAGRELPVVNTAVSAVNAAGQPGVYDVAYDAAPSADGTEIYFVASSKAGAGLFHVSAAGGDERAISIGAPFVNPIGVAVASDGQTIYVADPEAILDGAVGGIFAVAIQSGEVMLVAGTAGSGARGLEVKEIDGAEVIYFSGVDPSDGQTAVMSIAASGGELTVMAKGAPLVMPIGVAITDAGVVYVADRNGSGEGWGSVFRIEAGKIEQIADHFRTGLVVGAALTLDQGLLLVSALDASYDSAQVLVINLSSGELAVVNKGIAGNRGSGGVHRAQEVNIFAWADAPIKPPKSPCCAVYQIVLE